MKIIITGSAGFIGMHLTKKFLKNNFTVIGIDNLNEYYEKKLKLDRLKILKKYKNFHFIKADICNQKKMENIFLKFKPKCVIHLAAQAGVRYSLEHPETYINFNLLGFFNIINLSKKFKIKKFFYASSSSVYGGNKKIPFCEKDYVNDPLSLYSATKLSNEIIAKSFSNIYDMNIVGLRFFTVYGPWGRPDMALFKFTKNIILGKKIEVYNRGKMIRDFTYIDDVIECIFKLFCQNKKFKNCIFNIGNSSPIKLITFINYIEKFLDKKAKINLMPLQTGDVVSTISNSKKIFKLIKFKPNTNVKIGIRKFIEWYLKYNKYK